MRLVEVHASWPKYHGYLKKTTLRRLLNLYPFFFLPPFKFLSSLFIYLFLPPLAKNKCLKLCISFIFSLAKMLGNNVKKMVSKGGS